MRPALPSPLRSRSRVGQSTDFAPSFALAPQGINTLSAPGMPDLIQTPNGLITPIQEPPDYTPFCYDIIGRTVTTGLAPERVRIEFRVPGSFCPSRLLIDPAADVLIESISVGTENVIISGSVPGEVFGTDNNCRLDSCLRCICMPGVPLTITALVPAETEVNFTLLGCFREACDPDKPMVVVVAPDCPAYPEYLVGFETTVPAGGTSEVAVNTPGRFCPRRLLFGGSDGGIYLTAIVNGVENQIVVGETKTDFFSYLANNCPPLATDCICMPGVDLVFRFRNSGGAPVELRGVMVGTYQEMCP